MKKKCEIENCGRDAVDRYGKKWLCREHLCPEPAMEYLEIERSCWGGMKSNAIGLDTKELEYVDIEGLEESWYLLVEESVKERELEH